MPTDIARFSKPELSPRSLLRALLKHKLLGAAVAALIAAGGIAATFRMQPIYQADALILVDPQKIPERFVTSTVNTDVQDRLATINQEIQSSTHLRKIIEEYHLYPKQRATHTPEELVEIMRKDIQTVLEKGVGGNRPGAFRITYQAPDPFIAAKVVERITNFYIEENYRSRESQAEGTYSFIENQLKEAKQNLDQQERVVAEYKVQHNGELPQQEASLNAALARLQIELQGNQDAINRAQQGKLVLEGSLAAAETALAALRPPERIPRRPTAGDSQAVASAQSQSAPEPEPESRRIETQIATLRLRYLDDYPEIKRLKALLEVAQRQEQQEAAKHPPAAPPPAAAKTVAASAVPDLPPDQPISEQLAIQRAQATERITNLKSQIAATDREFQERRTERERIMRDCASYQRRIEQLPVRDLEMANLTRNYEFSKSYYNSLLTKKTEAEMATDLEKRQKAETFRVLDPARPPMKPVKPKRMLLAAMSILAGLAFGVVAAVGRELQTGVFLGEWELPAGTRVLARIPHIEPSLDSGNSGDPKEAGNEGAQRAKDSMVEASSPAMAMVMAKRSGNV